MGVAPRSLDLCVHQSSSRRELLLHVDPIPKLTLQHQHQYIQQTLQLLARGLEALPFAGEADRRDATAFLLKSRGGQLADLVTAQAAGEYEVRA